MDVHRGLGRHPTILRVANTQSSQSSIHLEAVCRPPPDRIIMYMITIIYLDETNSILAHILDKPTRVKRIMNEGIVFDRVDKDENILRSGSVIPPSRIVRIYWEDDFKDSE